MKSRAQIVSNLTLVSFQGGNAQSLDTAGGKEKCLLSLLGVESDDGNGRRAEKVPFLLKLVESLFPVQRSKEKHTSSNVSILKQVKNSYLYVTIILSFASLE